MLMNNEERLREYVNLDTIYQDFKKGKDVFSDFDMFCIEHCKDIEEMLEKVKQLEDDLYAANQCVNELLDVQERKNKVVEHIKKVANDNNRFLNAEEEFIIQTLGDDNE